MKRIVLVASVVGVCAIASESQAPGALRSNLVYPPQQIAIAMNHAHPAHARLRCVRCHDTALQSERSQDLLVPREEACVACHAETNRGDNGEPRGDCSYCHVGSDGTQIPPSSFPPPNLTFSHRQHAREGVGCLSCHGVQNTGVATRSHLPTMRQCFQCHSDEGDRGECGTCHRTQPNGRLRTQFAHAPEGRMLPPAWLHGMDHDRDFEVRHRWVAADQGELCAQCHSERECVDCHDGRGRTRQVHQNDFLTTHAQAAQRNQPRCSSCHTVQRFCTECHARMGMASFSASAVAAGAAFHPPGWDASHGAEARRSMAQCSSCHAERDCVTCHGAAGIGIGISPHPPGFTSQCRSALDRNPRACITCHGDVSGLCR